MSKRRMRHAAWVLCAVVVLVCAPTAAADGPDLTGQWYGTAAYQSLPGATGRISISIFSYAPGLYAGWVTYSDLGVFDALVPVTLTGDVVVIGDPSVLAFVGTLSDDVISGTTAVPAAYPPYYELVDWALWRDTGQGAAPGPFPTTPCEDLPDLLCAGSASHCSELVSFDPREGPGWLDYPLNGETWSDQWRSYLRRDLRQVLMYATAKVACMTADWGYWPLSPLGLGDMSEADGSIPGTSTGYPGHPAGSHEHGLDADAAYYQLFAPDNLLRVIGVHHDALYVDQGHLVEPPYALDVWRTALFLACLSEHPRVRVIGVDGQAGLLLEEALDDLVFLGWLDSDQRESIPLAYEVEDTGGGWFLYHHHHLHVSLNPVVDIVSSVDLEPRKLNPRSGGRWVTAFLELEAGYDPGLVAPSGVALILDGHTLLHAVPGCSRVGDHDRDGVPDLMLKFDRSRLLEALGPGESQVALTGSVSGVFFQQDFTVRVMDGKKQSPK